MVNALIVTHTEIKKSMDVNKPIAAKNCLCERTPKQMNLNSTALMSKQINYY